MGVPTSWLERGWRECTAAAAAGAAIVGAVAAGGWGTALFGAIALAAGAEACRRSRRELAMLARRLGPLSLAGTPGAPLSQLVDGVEARLAAVEMRLLHRHRVTGLPTREPLLQAMLSDGRGTLGIVGLSDFDRMCAFDEALGERAITALVERVRRMVGSGRLLAHVDRAQIAIWFGPDISDDAAQNELAAVAYALGSQIEDAEAGVTITPDVRWASACLPEDGSTPQAVLKRVIALLMTTDLPVSAATINPVAAARDRYEIEQDLRQAIARGEFEMLYQPLIDAAGACVCGAEALLRWHHPLRGTISPAQFIPLVESAGLADEVGLWTLNTACREAHSWQVNGLGALHVAVNASGHQLDRADMRALVERTLARHALAPELLEIELTETVAANDVTRAARLFDELRAMGVRIAIDDFGTGFSSLSALRRLTFDKIKIDREFVTHVDTRSDSQAICQSIVALARGLGIRVLGEGIERVEEYRWLRSHGCHHFQGYYFARPMTGEAFAAFAADRPRLAKLLATDARGMQQDVREKLTA